MKMKKFFPLLMVGLLTHLFSACIDEDLSDCPPKEKDVLVDYQIDLTHEIDHDYDARLQTLHLGFWDSQAHLFREVYFNEENMPAELVFTVTLPVKNYEHIAIANHDKGEGQRAYESFPHDITSVIIAETPYAPDTIRALAVPPFVGSEPMYMADNPDQTRYSVLLRPITAKLNIRVNHPQTLKNVRCMIRNTKAGYNCWNKTFIENDRLVTDAGSMAQPNADGTATDFTFYAYPTLVAEAAQIAGRATQAGEWKLYFYSDCGDKVIQHVFTVEKALEAGRVFDGEFVITEQGGEAVNVDASVEIDTDWNPGDDFDQEI